MRCFLSDTRAGDEDLRRPLYAASRNRHENVVALLVEACTSLDLGTRGLPGTLTHKALGSLMSEPVVHAILAMVYATMSGPEICLRQARDRDHKGAIVLWSYVVTLKGLERPHNIAYSHPLTHESGYFNRVVEQLARVPNIGPAFDLTLMTVERRRIQVLLEVGEGCGCVRVFFDSYHASIEDLSEGVSERYKKVVTIERSGKFSFTGVHQEENLKFTVRREAFSFDGSFVNFEIGGHSKRIESYSSEDVCVEFPIDQI